MRFKNYQNFQFNRFLHYNKDIEICGDWSDIEVSRCVFTQNDGITVYDGCREFLSRKSINDNTYCYLYATNDTYFYGNEEKIHKEPLVRNIDFYFKIKDIAAVTSHFLSVGTVTVQITDPSNYMFHLPVLICIFIIFIDMS